MIKRANTLTKRKLGSRISAAIVLLLLGTVLLRADENAASAPAAKPLAECKLQESLDAGQSPDMMNAQLAIFQQRGEQPLDQYQRGFGSEWQVPADVDANDPNLRLLLLAPAGPVVLDVAVYVEGKPFRAIRERWIDGAVNGEDVAAILGVPAEEEKDAEAEADGADETPAESESPPELESAATDETTATEDETASDEDESADETTTADSDAESADDEPADDEPADDEDAEAPADEPKRVDPKRHEPPGPLVRLTGYAGTLDVPLERAEARWLLAEWVPGPTLLELRHGYAWERSSLAPLLAVLDRDADGQLSAAEIDGAGARLVECDRNEDDSVSVAEINRVLKNSAAVNGWTPPRLLITLDAETDWSALARDVARVYPPSGETANGDCERFAQRLGVESGSPITPRHLVKLLEVPADVAVRVCFGESDEMPAGVSITQMNAEMGSPDDVLGANEKVITVDLGGSYVEISAAQGADRSGQISCGAVVDGFPLMRHLDRNDDRRFSLRELRDLADGLRQFDRNDDREVDAREIPTPIRLAVAQGPNVHAMLANPTAAALRQRTRRRQEAPIWFTPMDANRDGDITRSEFFGTDEQFQGLDADGDGLVSAAEAIASEQGNSATDEKAAEKEIENGAAGEDSAAASEQPAGE